MHDCCILANEGGAEFVIAALCNSIFIPNQV